MSSGIYITSSSEKVEYHSLYELKRMVELDSDDDVLSWSRCTIEIQFCGPQGEVCKFTPTLSVYRKNNITTLEDIKCKLTDYDVLKLKAAVDWCKERVGFKYQIIQYENAPALPTVKLANYSNEYGKFVRPTSEWVYISMACMVAAQSTCLRKKVAAVFTDSKLQRILCLGYNGNVAGGPNCCDSLNAGACGCTHAEINALTKNVEGLEGSTCFLTLSPCIACAKVLINRGIKRIVYYESYRDTSGIDLCQKYGIHITKFDNHSEYETGVANSAIPTIY
jgi:dCMP deaminase